MSVAEELREWARNGRARDRGDHSDAAVTRCNMYHIIQRDWSERIQAELDKKDALIARLQDMLDGARERYKEDSDRLGKKDAEIAELTERFIEMESSLDAVESESSELIDAKDAEIAALRADARALVDQLDAVHDDPSYMTLFVEAHIRGRPYEGLKYGDELTALKERLGEYSG